MKLMIKPERFQTNLMVSRLKQPVLSAFSWPLTLGIPVSTTHAITGAISGVGSVKRLSAVRWDATLKIVWTWFLTIPAALVMAYFVYKLLDLIFL